MPTDQLSIYITETHHLRRYKPNGTTAEISALQGKEYYTQRLVNQ